MRIAVLVNGMTGYLDAEFLALQALGHELLVVTPGSPRVAVGAMVDTDFKQLKIDASAEVLAWEQQPDPQALVEKVRAFGPDAVLMTSWNFSPAYRAVMKDVPSSVVRVLIMDNLWRATSRQWLGRATHRWYVDTVADAVLVPSDRSEFYARRLGFSAADVIRGSISADTDLFHSAARTGDELSSRRAFLFVGRLVDHKGADVLAASYRAYRENHPDPWDLHVAGIGPLEPLLRDLPGVTLHGFCQPPEIAELMREVSCQLVTSHIEPYGVVVHEAAASGLPLLVGDVTGAAPGLVQDGQNGWVVPSGDIPAWTSALGRMSALPPERLAHMSQVSRALSQRISPSGWALNLTEELERRSAAGGGRLGR